MKSIIAIISIIFLLGCRTKVTEKQKYVSEEKSEIQVDKKIDSIENKTEKKSETKQNEVSEQKREYSKDFEIKGKAETNKPIEIYDIENGDTLQAVKVIGNAEVFLKTKRSSSNLSKKEIIHFETQNFIEKISREAVKEKNLKTAGKTIKESAKKLTVKDTNTGIYISIVSLGIVSIIFYFIFLYLKKNKR